MRTEMLADTSWCTSDLWCYRLSLFAQIRPQYKTSRHTEAPGHILIETERDPLENKEHQASGSLAPLVFAGKLSEEFSSFRRWIIIDPVVQRSK